MPELSNWCPHPGNSDVPGRQAIAALHFAPPLFPTALPCLCQPVSTALSLVAHNFSRNNEGNYSNETLKGGAIFRAPQLNKSHRGTRELFQPPRRLRTFIFHLRGRSVLAPEESSARCGLSLMLGTRFTRSLGGAKLDTLYESVRFKA
jgi:hypothetical protein